MKILFHDKALKELRSFDNKVYSKFAGLFDDLSKGRKLPENKFKNLGRDKLYELRIRHNKNSYRAIGALINPELFILVSFKKKTQKIPTKYIKLAKLRLLYLLNKKNES